MDPTYAEHSLGPLGTKFYVPNRLTRLVETFAGEIEKLTAPREAPKLIEIEDAILVNRPNASCLYDRDGRRIAASELVRYADDLTPQPWPSVEELTPAPVGATIREPVVFRSMYFEHWGHFLLESLARLWATETLPELADLSSIFCLAWGRSAIEGRYAEVLEHLGVRALPPPAEDRVRLAKVYIPTPSLQIGLFCDPLHLLAPRRLARKLVGAAARNDQPVYFSRTDSSLGDHKFRRYQNEIELEEALAARGVRIVHMQHLSLAEQIGVMNSHRTFIGPFGSALHNILFSLNGREISTYVLIGTWLPRDFLRIDSVVGNRAHYLVVCPMVSSEGQTRVVSIDVRATLSYLTAHGVI